MPEKKELISHHVFFFPFKWEILGPERDFSKRHDLQGSDEMLGANWQKSKFKLDKITHRNEFNYFYDFVREVIYDLDGSDLEQHEANRSYLDHYYFVPAENKGTYRITIPRKEHANPEKNRDKVFNLKDHRWKDVDVKADKSGALPPYVYDLEIDSILLHLYATGVGVLSFHLNNRAYACPEDILRINQYGRRIFPPFYGIANEKIGHLHSSELSDFQNGLNMAKGNEVAGSISLIGIGQDIEEDFGDYSNEKYYTVAFRLPKFISGLCPHMTFRYDKKSKDGFFVSPVLDDRMFVLCWYGNERLSSNLVAIAPDKNTTSGKWLYTESDFWYEYAFLDKPNGKSCQNIELAKQQISEVTNARWADYGTWYAITPYSLVSLTGSLPYLRQDSVNAAFLVMHMQTIYCKLTELVLMQKACLLKFSDEITRVSNIKDKSVMMLEAKGLYLEYLRFINKIYFREVTAQTQGIELYQALQHQLHIERDVQGLNQEIAELYNYIQLQKQMEQQETAEKLSKIAAWFLPPTLVTAIFGLSTISNDTFRFYGGPPNWLFWESIFFIAIISLITHYGFNRLILKTKKSS